MLHLITVENIPFQTIRMVENWGSSITCELRYCLASEGGKDLSYDLLFALTWITPKCEGIRDIPSLVIVLEPETGRLCELDMLLVSTRISPLPDILTPVRSSHTFQMGLPRFDCSLWKSGTQEVVADQELIIGWTSSGELGIFFEIAPVPIAKECAVDSTLSLLFDEHDTMIGLLMRSFSRVDRLVIQQVEPSSGM